LVGTRGGVAGGGRAIVRALVFSLPLSEWSTLLGAGTLEFEDGVDVDVDVDVEVDVASRLPLSAVLDSCFCIMGILSSFLRFRSVAAAAPDGCK